MSEEPRNRILGVEIQHIFVSEIRSSPDAARGYALLQSVNFDLESRGNKLALLARSNLRDAILNAPAAIKQALVNAGFGLNTQNSYRMPNAHPEYNAFNIEALNRLSEQADEGNWTQQARERAVFDLHRFMSAVNDSGFPPVQGTSLADFRQAWATWRGERNYAALDTADAQVIDSVITSYDSSPIDVKADGTSTGNNRQLRVEAAEALYSAAQSVLSDAELANARSNLDRGNVTQALTSLIHDLQIRSSTPVIGIAVAAENAAAKLLPDLPDGVDYDALTDTLTTVMETIAPYADSIAESVSGLGDDLITTIGRSINAMLVGLGGNAIGDIVEFLNVAYEPIKKGFQTGDWSDFGATVAQYGVAAAVSAVLVIGSVAAASFFAGPIAAAFVAAGWAAYGLYDAVTNGVELLGRITTDLSDVADRIGATIETLGNAAEGYAHILQRIIANAMDVDFGAPVFAGGADGTALARRYLVDPLDNRLPGSVVGTAANERFYGQNNATIDARGGNDEVYLRNGGIALGGAGDDILAGRGGPRATRGNSDFSGGGGDFGGGGASGSWEGPAGSVYTLTLDGGVGNDWVIATGGQASVTIGGLGRDWLYNTSVGGIIWGDVVNSVEAADGSRFVVEGGVRREIADDARNADSFWFAPDVTIMDAQTSDRLRFFGLTLSGGDTTLTAAALAVSALSNPLFGAGVAGAAAAVNLNRFVSGEPLIYFDRFVPWITYTLVEGAAPGTQDLIVGNVFDALGRFLIDAPSIYETDNGDGTTTNYAGTLRVVDFDRGAGRIFSARGDLGISLDGVRARASGGRARGVANPLALFSLFTGPTAGVPIVHSLLNQLMVTAAASNDNEVTHGAQRHSFAAAA